MKKVIFLLAAIALMQFVPNVKGSADDLIEWPEEGDIMHCRCKQEGCYAGNAFSLRPECATGHGSIECWKYNANCEGYVEDPEDEGGREGEIIP